MTKSSLRSVQLLKNLSVAAQVVGTHLGDDPVLLALQISRKLPYRLARVVGSALSAAPGIGVQTVGAQMLGADFLPAAHAVLERGVGDGDSRWNRLQHRLVAEAGISAGAIDWRDSSLPASTRARAAWDAGALSEAIEIARAGGALSYARRLEGERDLLTPDFELNTTELNEQNDRYMSEAGRAARVEGATREASPQNSGKLTAVHLLTNSLPATQSGYTLRTHRLLQSLAQNRALNVLAFTRIGYPVAIGALGASATAQVDAINYRRILPARLGKTHPERLAQWVREVAQHVLAETQQNQPRIVHTTTNYPNALAAVALARTLDAPWVYEVRGIMEETWASNKKTAAARAEAEASERFALIRARETQLMRQADHVITLSQVMKEQLVRRGIAPERITVVPNAVNDSLFEQNLTPHGAREQLGLNQSGFWVGSVSSLVDYEGFDTLLRAVAMARQTGRDVRVLLTGDGIVRGKLQDLASELELGENAVFLGKVAPEQAFVAHQALNAFVVPRKNVKVAQSVTPLKPIEAMALGRAVIASDIPPLAELVHNDVAAPAGLLAEAENPASFARVIEQLMDNSELTTQLVHNGKELARTRTWGNNAKIVHSIYRKVLKVGMYE